MAAFLHGLTNFAKGAYEVSGIKNEVDKRKYAEHERQQDQLNEDNQFVEMVQGKGGKFAHAGMVHDDGGVLRRADPSRLVKHKTANGEVISFELPTPEEQIRTNADRLMQQFTSQAPMRGAQAGEATANAGAEAGARANATNAAKDAERQQIGVPIDSLESVFPGISQGGNMPRPSAAPAMSATSSAGEFNKREPKKVLPTEFDDLVRAGANKVNIDSQIKQRDAKPTRSIKATTEKEDDAGNVTQVITYDDGTVTTKSLGKIGKKTKPSSEGGITAYQGIELKNRAEDKKAKAIESRQTELDKIQTQQDKLVSDTEAASEEYKGLQTELAAGNFESVAQKSTALKKSAELKGKIAANHVAHTALEGKKKTVDAIRKSLIGQADTAAAGAQDAATKAVDANPIRYNAKGEGIQWNGKQWAPIQQQESRPE